MLNQIVWTALPQARRGERDRESWCAVEHDDSSALRPPAPRRPPSSARPSPSSSVEWPVSRGVERTEELLGRLSLLDRHGEEFFWERARGGGADGTKWARAREVVSVAISTLRAGWGLTLGRVEGGAKEKGRRAGALKSHAWPGRVPIRPVRGRFSLGAQPAFWPLLVPSRRSRAADLWLAR